MALPLHVIPLGRDGCADHWHHYTRAARHKLLVVPENGGTLSLDFTPHTLQRGTLYPIGKGQVYSLHYSTETEAYIIEFDDEFFEGRDAVFTYNKVDLKRIFSLQTPIADSHSMALAQELLTECQAPDWLGKEEKQYLLARLLLLQSVRYFMVNGDVSELSHEKKVSWAKQFATFTDLLHNRYTSMKNAKEFAEMMGISYKFLNDICKYTTTKTAKQIIDDLLVLEIKRHLATVDVPIKELSIMLGFDEPTNFIKYFRKLTGRTPKQFRAQLAQNLTTPGVDLT